MVEFSDTRNARNPTMPAPTIIGLLPDKQGGETNLLPEALTRSDLKVWFTVPVNSDPSIAKETVALFVDGNPTPLVSREWTQPIEESDRFLEVPSAWLRSNDGQHRFFYRMTIYNGEQADSVDLIMTLDTVAPLLPTVSKLIFPPEVTPPNRLTARYLEQNSDQVKASIPPYTTPRPWDRITWYWGSSPGNTNQGGVIELDDTNYSAPLIITVAGQLIRDRSDGFRYVWYEVHDRAGNVSRPSEPLELDVAATPIPRTLPPVKVKDATGGTSSGTLNPSLVISGATVTVLPQAIIYDGEPVFVQWGEQDTAGGHRTDIPITPGTRDYRIPSDKVAWHIGKTLLVRYEVFEPGIVDSHKSQPYTLGVNALNGPPTIQCDGVSGGNLKLANIPSGGYANFTLRSWAFMATNQFLTVTVLGVDSNSQQLSIPVLTESPVPEVGQTISTGRISKADLQRFRIGNKLEVRVSVSFDGKLTWQRFPSLTPTLVA